MLGKLAITQRNKYINATEVALVSMQISNNTEVISVSNVKVFKLFL